MPGFSEMAIFIVRPQYNLNPGVPWDVELMVRKQTGPLSSEFVTFRAVIRCLKIISVDLLR